MHMHMSMYEHVTHGHVRDGHVMYEHVTHGHVMYEHVRDGPAYWREHWSAWSAQTALKTATRAGERPAPSTPSCWASTVCAS
jgi:hypothetical protein